MNENIEYQMVTEFFETIMDFPPQDRQMYKFARRRHTDTKAIRRATGEPYFVHPEAVAKIAIAYGGNDIEVKAALAHDTMEDTGATYDDIKEKFGQEVADIVQELTNDNQQIKELGKEEYMNLKIASISDTALFVKLCDMLHNTLDHPRPNQMERMKRNIDYLIAHRKLDSREKELIDSIMTRMIGDEY